METKKIYFTEAVLCQNITDSKSVYFLLRSRLKWNPDPVLVVSERLPIRDRERICNFFDIERKVVDGNIRCRLHGAVL